jgi:hypothetical protein
MKLRTSREQKQKQKIVAVALMNVGRIPMPSSYSDDIVVNAFVCGESAGFLLVQDSTDERRAIKSPCLGSPFSVLSK